MKLERLGSSWIRGVIPTAPSSNELGIEGGGDGVVLEGRGGGELATAVAAVGAVAAPGGTELTEAEIEEKELVEWANLKECQMKFIRENGMGRLM